GNSTVSTNYAVDTARDATITIADYGGPLDDQFFMYHDGNSGEYHFVYDTPPNVLTNDPVSGTPFVVQGHGPQFGTVTLSSNGAVDYTPDSDWPGQDSFVYALD